MIIILIEQHMIFKHLYVAHLVVYVVWLVELEFSTKASVNEGLDGFVKYHCCSSSFWSVSLYIGVEDLYFGV